MVQKNRSANLITGAIRNSLLANDRLANLGAEEFAVALEAQPAAAEQVGHSRDRLLGVGGARTDSENQIAKRKFGSGLKDEVVFFHCCWSFDSIFGASVQS